MQLTPNFGLEEFTATSAPYLNEPDTHSALKVHLLCLAILQPLRDRFGPVTVTSGYRSPLVNKHVGGSASSQHLRGEAADIKVPGTDMWQWAKWIVRHTPFDQLIIYPGQDRCHVSYKSEEANRREILLATTNREGGVKYERYPLLDYGWQHER